MVLDFKMTRQVDKLIELCRALYLAMISFGFFYAFVSANLYHHNQGVQNLLVFDRLVALRYLAKEPNIRSRQATLEDLPKYYSAAWQKWFDQLEQAEKVLDKDADDVIEGKTITEEKPDRMKDFRDSRKKPIAGAVIELVPMPLARVSTCDVLVWNLSAGSEFQVPSLGCFRTTIRSIAKMFGSSVFRLHVS